MEIFAKLESIQGNQIKLSLDEDFSLYKLDKYSDGKQPTVELRIDDGRSISNDQRKKIYALLRDIEEHTGYMDKDDVKAFPEIMKYEYLINTGNEMFSLSDCSMTIAHDYLEWILDFCYKWDIPFKTRTWDMLPVDFAMQKRSLQHKQCCICREPAQIAHYDAVGMGSNRNTDTRSHYLMALCWKHHDIQHDIGVITFCKDKHIKPVKITADEYNKLRQNKEIEWEETIEIIS